ncbi:MAG: 6-phospho-beta-glucosidase [Fusobacteriaceae bacterium]|jgi:6-phospho-beta-glucosidase|nr:6-phospho-beta-glucosidase [Fusobacteriaceae bacterium]
MNKELKISIIGGGSSYTPEIIDGFIKKKDELNIKEICLIDIEEGQEKLNIIYNLTKRMIDKNNLNWNISKTIDRIKGLENSDFVVTQFRVGQIDARIKDESIPLKYGCIGQETTGAGGFAKALRTVPVILDICKDIEKVAKNAWLINFTNPSGILTEAVLKYTNVKVIGLCNVPVNMQMGIAKILNCDTNDFIFQATGLNHLLYGKHIIKDNKDIITEVLQKYIQSDEFNPKNIDSIPWIDEQILDLNMLPCPYHKYFYLTSDMLNAELKEFKEGRTRGTVVKQVEKELFEKYKNPDLNEKPKELEKRGGAYYSDTACELISSIVNDKNKLMIVDVQNNGTLNFLPNNVSIETTCLINKNGAFPLSVDDFDNSSKSLISTIKAYESLTIEAAINGDYTKALQALTTHPLVTSGKIAKNILDDIILENKKYLSNFYKGE